MTNTLRSSWQPTNFKERPSARSGDQPTLDRKIRKLEQICQRLQQRPTIDAGVSADELIEILRAEEKRLKAIA